MTDQSGPELRDIRAMLSDMFQRGMNAQLEACGTDDPVVRLDVGAKYLNGWLLTIVQARAIAQDLPTGQGLERVVAHLMASMPGAEGYEVEVLARWFAHGESDRAE